MSIDSFTMKEWEEFMEQQEMLGDYPFSVPEAYFEEAALPRDFELPKEGEDYEE